jgi:NADPH2:quinone reductase
MKAVRVREVGSPETMRLEEIADYQPKLGELFVRMKAVDVNQLETYIRSGVYGTLPQGGAYVKIVLIP